MLNLLQANNLTLADLLPDPLMSEILSRGRRATYSDGQLIQQRGDFRPGLSFVESGQAIAGNVGTDGAFFTTTLLNPGDFFGEFTLFVGLPRTQDLQANGETVIVHVGSRAVAELLDREPGLARALLTITLRRMHFLVEFLDGQRRLPLPVRIAHLLLTAVVDGEATVAEKVSCRQEDLAAMLGVSRVGVGKALKKLEHAGLVENGYGSIGLPDVQRLSAWLEENYEVSPVRPHEDWRFEGDWWRLLRARGERGRDSRR